MKAVTATGAIVALALTTHTFAGEAQPDPALSIHVGTFFNSGWGQIDYEGDFGHLISVTAAAQNQTMFPTEITVDLSSLLDEAGYNAFTAVTVRDTGQNIYGANSPGADLDLFTIDGLGDSFDVLLRYEGPVTFHELENSDTLKTRTADLDALSGFTHENSLQYVSLGDRGELTAHVSGWDAAGSGGDDGDGPIIPQLRGIDGSGISLMLSEAGMGESFDVYVTATNVPAPGALALLGLAGLAGSRGRRRA